MPNNIILTPVTYNTCSLTTYHVINGSYLYIYIFDTYHNTPPVSVCGLHALEQINGAYKNVCTSRAKGEPLFLHVAPQPYHRMPRG